MGDGLTKWARDRGVEVDAGQREHRLRTKIEIEEQRTLTIRWYLGNVSLAEIATKLNSTVETVTRDLQAVRAEWERARITDFNSEVAKQLARIDAIEAENWDAWYASKGETKKTRGETKTVMTRNGPQQVSSGIVTTEVRTGDTQYMLTLRWCIEERSKLLGLYAPKKLAIHATNDASEDGHEASDEERLIALAQQFQRAQLAAGDAPGDAVTVDGSATEVVSRDA